MHYLMAVLVAVLSFGVRPESNVNTTVDTCKWDTYEYQGFRIECEDDYPCDVVIAKTFTGECWWTTQPYRGQ